MIDRRGCTCRGREFGQHRIQIRTRLRIQQPTDRRHAIKTVLPDGYASAAGAVDIGELTIRIQQGHHPVGAHPQRLGPKPDGHQGQLPLGGFAGRGIHHDRQPIKEATNDPHMLLAHLAAT